MRADYCLPAYVWFAAVISTLNLFSSLFCILLRVPLCACVCARVCVSVFLHESHYRT